MEAIDSDDRVTAQLSRLIGIAGAELNEDLSEAALRAAGALCDFEAGCDLRTKCLAAAAAVAAGSSRVAGQVTDAFRTARCAVDAGLDGFGCVVEVSLTLLEGASLQGGPPAEVQNCIIYVTGQHSWVHKDVWVLSSACVDAVLGAKRVMCFSTPSPGNLQRKVVLAANLGCAPLRTLWPYLDLLQDELLLLAHQIRPRLE